jgi:type III secretion protein Q
MDTTRTLLTDGGAPAALSHGVAVSLDATQLPTLAIDTARQHRLAVDERLIALLAHTFGVTDWSVGTRAYVKPDHAVVLSLRWGMEMASVRINIAQHPALASVVTSNEPASARLRDAVSAILLRPLVRALHSLGFDGVTIASLERAAHVRPHEPCCALAFRLGDARLDVVIEHIDRGWLDALEVLVTQQCMPLAAHVSDIVVPGRLRIGEKTMSLTALDSLRTGDIILRTVPDPIAALLRNEASPARMSVVWGRYGTRQLSALADVTHHRLILSEDPTMTDDTQFSAPLIDPMDTPVEISQLDLPLRLEIDTVSMPVAQLSALRAGYVLELPTAVRDARIRLVAYGQTIGFGELVSVGDHLGVRLVQIARGHDSV